MADIVGGHGTLDINTERFMSLNNPKIKVSETVEETIIPRFLKREIYLSKYEYEDGSILRGASSKLLLLGKTLSEKTYPYNSPEAQRLAHEYHI